MNERFIRITHAAIFACTFIVGIITLGISVSVNNNTGGPGGKSRVSTTLRGANHCLMIIR